jgi:hypothetical protein
MAGCVLAHPNRYWVLILALTIAVNWVSVGSKRVPSVHSRWEVQWCGQRWMVDCDCVSPGSLVASISGIILLAQLPGRSLESIAHIVHLFV